MPKKPVISTVHTGPSLGEGKRDLLNLMGFIAESFRRASASDDLPLTAPRGAVPRIETESANEYRGHGDIRDYLA